MSGCLQQNGWDSKRRAAKGVIAASAGNHAQGVALGAQKLKIPAVIVMPTTTPEIKVRSVRARGAQVILHGDSFDEAFAKSQELVDEFGYTYLHPFDDIEVIAGQGTVAVELLRQVTRPVDAVFIPVGGGGLAAGMAAYIKYVRPEIKVIAVEPEDAACLALQRWRLKSVWSCRKSVYLLMVSRSSRSERTPLMF